MGCIILGSSDLKTMSDKDIKNAIVNAIKADRSDVKKGVKE